MENRMEIRYDECINNDNRKHSDSNDDQFHAKLSPTLAVRSMLTASHYTLRDIWSSTADEHYNPKIRDPQQKHQKQAHLNTYSFKIV